MKRDNLPFGMERGVTDILFNKPEKLVNFCTQIKTEKNKFAGFIGI